MDRTVVAITGASSGIGAAFARKLAPGHDLILIARRKDRLQELARELEQGYGSTVTVMQADLTSQIDLAAAADRIASEPRLALLINNAGFGTRGRFWEAPLESQEQMHRLHVTAILHLTHAALRNMVPRDFGGVINVSSVSAFLRTPGATSYSATKTWINAFTEGLHLELRSIGSNVLVQALCPGYTYSEFHDVLGARREELGGPAYWFTADQVVEASIDGLRRRKLFVVPGWRYRLITALLSTVPTSMRLGIEAVAGRARRRALTEPVVSDPSRQVGDR